LHNVPVVDSAIPSISVNVKISVVIESKWCDIEFNPKSNDFCNSSDARFNDGREVGCELGDDNGDVEGWPEGSLDGINVGCPEGWTVGWPEGSLDGALLVGSLVGCPDG
jgi:hypothetical protein